MAYQSTLAALHALWMLGVEPASCSGTLLPRVPGLRACGVDASADMLIQARLRFRAWPEVELLQVKVGAGATADLPYATRDL